MPRATRSLASPAQVWRPQCEAAPHHLQPQLPQGVTAGTRPAPGAWLTCSLLPARSHPLGWGGSELQGERAALAPKISGRRRAAARAAEGRGTPEKDQPGLRQTDPNPQQQLTLSGEQAAAAEEEGGPGGAGRASTGPSSCSPRSGLFVWLFLPSCTSGWFRIGWKEEVQERGEALCVVCGRKRSSGKPPFPLRGKQCFQLANPTPTPTPRRLELPHPRRGKWLCV